MKYAKRAPEDLTPRDAGDDSGMSGSAGQQAGMAHVAGKKILCIEDEHFISELYNRTLTKAGYVVTSVIDGEEGLKEAQTDNYDIILLDIMVPNLTGIEILKRLRGPEQTPKLHAKIIITTNLEQSEEGRAAIEKQADGYIVKAEVTPKQLLHFLQQLKL